MPKQWYIIEAAFTVPGRYGNYRTVWKRVAYVCGKDHADLVVKKLKPLRTRLIPAEPAMREQWPRLAVKSPEGSPDFIGVDNDYPRHVRWLSERFLWIAGRPDIDRTTIVILPDDEENELPGTVNQHADMLWRYLKESLSEDMLKRLFYHMKRHYAECRHGCND